MKKICLVLAMVFVLMSQGLAHAEGEQENAARWFGIASPVSDTVITDDVEFVDLYAFGNAVNLSSYPVLMDKTLMLPMQEFLAELGVNDFSVDEENQITITYGTKIVVMHLDSTTAYLNYEEAELPVAPFLSGDVVYAPAQVVCKALDFIYAPHSDGKTLSVHITEKDEEVVVTNAAFQYTFTEPEYTLPKSATSSAPTGSNAEKAINSRNISSDTGYLIWVNKSSYTVYVFSGSKNNWNQIYSCACAIGASNRPTVTGTFKYFSLEKQWKYDNFYVGPVMRFHGSYAIHSTLLKYDGTDYNNTVGAKISHGCVRVRPNNIAWLTSTIPLKTTVYVSEN